MNGRVAGKPHMLAGRQDTTAFRPPAMIQGTSARYHRTGSKFQNRKLVSIRTLPVVRQVDANFRVPMPISFLFLARTLTLSLVVERLGQSIP